MIKPFYVNIVYMHILYLLNTNTLISLSLLSKFDVIMYYNSVKKDFKTIISFLTFELLC